MVVCHRMDELGVRKKLLKMVQQQKKKWMIWISDDIDRLLLGAVVVLFAAGAALRGWFRTSWLASTPILFERVEEL